MLDIYPVNETFLSWQGEGVHMGRKAFFIRLQGCPVKCVWCDSASTWHPKYVPKKVREATAEELAQEALISEPEFVVITGGEPCIHDLARLLAALTDSALKVHLETCGAFTIPAGLSWVTVSPKWGKPPLEASLQMADEIKLIVEAPDSIERWTKFVGGRWHARHVWLHPEWTRHEDPLVLGAITQHVKNAGYPFRAGWQIHKPYGADSLDPRSRAPVPLGGQIANRF